jgi:hypothetical protein
MQLLLLASELRSRATEISPGNERGHPGSQNAAIPEVKEWRT